ncbi:hypothetical protein SUGI_0380930 [Cryptomeria japonica]|nr:hypothetical protein SUGI_0380930 [Cryptomeria japonica]
METCADFELNYFKAHDKLQLTKTRCGAQPLKISKSIYNTFAFIAASTGPAVSCRTRGHAWPTIVQTDHVLSRESPWAQPEIYLTPSRSSNLLRLELLCPLHQIRPSVVAVGWCFMRLLLIAATISDNTAILSDSDKKALDFIENVTIHADEVQTQMLSEILLRNAHTEFLECYKLNGHTDRDSLKKTLARDYVRRSAA